MLRRDDSERGSILVMTALMITVMLGISALVVDIGFAYQKRRQIQNGADAAALGAAQDLPVETAAVAEAQSLSLANLADGSFPWPTCQDPNHLAIVSSTTQCVSFDSSFTRVRVKIPPQVYDTFFARALGIDTVTTGGTAIARIVGAGFGSIQPFSLYSGFTSGLACLKQGPSGHQIDTCDEPETGNFNLLDITQYGNESLGTDSNCGNSAQRQRMVDNIAIGSDHAFTLYTTTAIVDGCGTAGPNTLPPRTGDDLDAFDLGLVHGTTSYISDGGPARLARGGYDKATVMGVPLDNKPLWEFIPDQTLSDIPTSCQRSTFNALLDATPTAQQQAVMSTALETCFTDYDDGDHTGILFSANTDPFGKEVPIDLFDIQLSPRLAYVPQFLQTGPPPGSSADLNIIAFRPVYLFETFAKCSSRGTCDVEFAPGPWNTGSSGADNDKAQALTSWVFVDTMLPSGLRGNPSSIGQNNYVQLID